MDPIAAAGKFVGFDPSGKAGVESFRTLGTRFLQMPLGDVAHVDLRARAAA